MSKAKCDFGLTRVAILKQYSTETSDNKGQVSLPPLPDAKDVIQGQYEGGISLQMNNLTPLEHN